MDIRFHSAGKSGIRLDCVIIPTFSGSFPAKDFVKTPVAWLAESSATHDHQGEKNEVTVCYNPSSSGVRRVVMVGLGKEENLSVAVFRDAVALAVRRCKGLRLSKLGIFSEGLHRAATFLHKAPEYLLRETLVAANLAVYSYQEYKSASPAVTGKKDTDSATFSPESLAIIHGGKAVPASFRIAVRLADAEVAGIRLTRDLVNAPPNILSAARLAEEAVTLARRHGFGCRVLHKAELTKLGMGAYLAVNEGSAREPRFIVLEYVPKSGPKRSPLVLVGKGITFDSGGISLKPAAGMHLMKGDMAGAAAVLGAFEAIGRFGGVAVPVVGLLPCAENMPSGTAFRPGDVVTSMSGKTVEILNTDAEGRLILCDALTYAQKNWKPLAVVDIATLTGACMVALGRGAAGLFTKNTVLRDRIMELGEELGDTFWPMPLWEHLAGGLKSDVADIANVGAREGGAISAALFLESFVENGVAWAHLDMAGAGISEKDAPTCPKGATGFGVRTLFSLARTLNANSLR